MAEDYESRLFDSCLVSFVISKSLSPQSIVQVCTSYSYLIPPTSKCSARP